MVRKNSFHLLDLLPLAQREVGDAFLLAQNGQPVGELFSFPDIVDPQGNRLLVATIKNLTSGVANFKIEVSFFLVPCSVKLLNLINLPETN